MIPDIRQLLNALQFRLGFFLLLIAMASESFAADGWRLVWSDEFLEADGSAPRTANWSYDVGGGGWGNSELESYTSSRANSRIENGTLVIEARKESYTGSDGIPRNYTSARLKTQGKLSWAYGRMEARIKLPRGQGIWPAFWMLGANISTVGWPNSGEIDIMENIGREPSIVHGTLHGPGYSGGGGIGGPYTMSGGNRFADDFHLFAIEWETNRVRWFVDNHLYFTVTPANLPAGRTWVFDKPQFILLNMAVGGNWPGNPDSTTIFPQQMRIDYVRVYARTNAPTASLQIQKFPDGVKALWPGEFPHALLQRVTAFGQSWQEEPITGVRELELFSQTVQPGWYRLKWLP